MVLQDPQTSLNPVYTIGSQVTEAIAMHREVPRRSLLGHAVAVLRQVRVAAPDQRVKDYPHQMSGGMKQRVVGAIAISCDPHLLIADEPTTALDVTIQSQYLRLLRDIQEETEALHHLHHARLRHRRQHVRPGRGDVRGTAGGVRPRPLHLQRAETPLHAGAAQSRFPAMDRPVSRLYSIPGQPPVLWDLPQGCRFVARCPVAEPRCENPIPARLRRWRDPPRRRPRRKLLEAGRPRMEHARKS